MSRHTLHSEKLVTTNSIPLPADRQVAKVEVISVAQMLADVIVRIQQGESISERIVLS